MVLANIAVLKTIPFFGYVTAMGNIIYASTFFITDILSENHSHKDAQKAVWIGFFTLISTTVIMQLTLMFVPHSSDFAQGSLATIFGFFPRIARKQVKPISLISNTGYQMPFVNISNMMSEKRSTESNIVS